MEAVTNEIKKLANNARNKLKSQLSALALLVHENISIIGQYATELLSINSDFLTGIEQNLASNTEERVSADVRIKKSQVTTSSTTSPQGFQLVSFFIHSVYLLHFSMPFLLRSL